MNSQDACVDASEAARDGSASMAPPRWVRPAPTHPCLPAHPRPVTINSLRRAYPGPPSLWDSRDEGSWVEDRQEATTGVPSSAAYQTDLSHNEAHHAIKSLMKRHQIKFLKEVSRGKMFFTPHDRANAKALRRMTQCKARAAKSKIERTTNMMVKKTGLWRSSIQPETKTGSYGRVNGGGRRLERWRSPFGNIANNY